MESRRRREFYDVAIGNLLRDSDIGDFIPSDDDFDDLEFVRPESSMSSTEEESDGPDISTSFIQARGRTRRGTRGVSRGRSRGRSRGPNSTGSRIDNTYTVNYGLVSARFFSYSTFIFIFCLNCLIILKSREAAIKVSTLITN